MINFFVETQYVQLSKRKGKTGELPYEDISFDVYQQKKCGFLTKRPLAWATAIETYLNERHRGEMGVQIGKRKIL